MHEVIDLAGATFGKLTVLSRVENSKFGEAQWLCKCDCGETRIVLSSNLRKGKQKSCGCLRHKPAWNRTHGEANVNITRLYRIWCDMKTRCYNPNRKAYKDYGGRGITICDEWRNSYETFRDWAYANGYSDKLTLDRRDNNEGYAPDNCRWTTMIEQANNRRSTRYVYVDGAKMAVADAARHLGIEYHKYISRMYRKEAVI